MLCLLYLYLSIRSVRLKRLGLIPMVLNHHSNFPLAGLAIPITVRLYLLLGGSALSDEIPITGCSSLLFGHLRCTHWKWERSQRGSVHVEKTCDNLGMQKPSQDASGGVKFRFRSPTTLHNDPAGMGSILVVFWDRPSFWKMQFNPSGNVKPTDFTRGDSEDLSPTPRC